MNRENCVGHEHGCDLASMGVRVRFAALVTLTLCLLRPLPLHSQGLGQPTYVGIRSGQFNFVAAAQVQNEWCWAASTQMILNWYGIPVNQAQIVSRIFGGPVNTPGSDRAISAALNGWAMTANGRPVVIRSYTAAGPPPPHVLLSQLNGQHPILLTFMTGPYSGHAVVVTAASYVPSPAGPYITSIVIRDPWPSPQNIQTEGREEIGGPALAQFLPSVRSYWLVSVQ